MPLRRITLPVLVVIMFVAGLFTGPAANAATHPNWLRHCTSHVTRSCVVEDAKHGPDSTRSITFRTSKGHAVTVHSPARAWRIVTAHSHRCKSQFVSSCYLRDDVTGLRFIVYPSGLHVAVKRIR